MKRLTGTLLAALLLLCSISPAFAASQADDDTPPELESIAVDRVTVRPGGEVIVSADAWDDDSGVKSITATFRHETTGAELRAELLRNSNADISEEFSAALRIPKDAAAGRYALRQVTVRDREENRARYTAGRSEWDSEKGLYPLTTDVSFTVTQQGAPTQPSACAVTRLQSGAYRLTVTFAAGAEADKVTLLYENAANHHKYILSVGEDERQADGSFRKQFTLAPYEPAGTFTLKKITVKDANGAKQTWSQTVDEDSDDLPLTLASSFTTENSSPDRSAPEFLDLTVSAPVQDDNDEKTRYTIEVRATDDLSGVEHITVKFKDPVSGESVGKVLRAADLQENGRYRARLAVKYGQTPGLYRLDSVTVCDYAGNRVTYCTQTDLTDSKRRLPVQRAISINQ